uniref:Uncharacterized protein n=1 Tax=Ananas comosus var. bracteatus TaxID=296719 RepID=A0A6V7NT88_ANACO|nr:unnamed protein product [Ananas comosus var. bracteatus]
MRTNGGARDNIAAPAVLPLASPIPGSCRPNRSESRRAGRSELAAAAAKSVLLSLCLPLLLLPLRGDASFAATALCSARRTSDPFKPPPVSTPSASASAGAVAGAGAKSSSSSAVSSSAVE